MVATGEVKNASVVRFGNYISLLDETSMRRRGLRSEGEKKWGEECDAFFASGAIEPGEER